MGVMVSRRRAWSVGLLRDSVFDVSFWYSSLGNHLELSAVIRNISKYLAPHFIQEQFDVILGDATALVRG